MEDQAIGVETVYIGTSGPNSGADSQYSDLQNGHEEEWDHAAVRQKALRLLDELYDSSALEGIDRVMLGAELASVLGEIGHRPDEPVDPDDVQLVRGVYKLLTHPDQSVFDAGIGLLPAVYTIRQKGFGQGVFPTDGMDEHTDIVLELAKMPVGINGPDRVDRFVSESWEHDIWGHQRMFQELMNRVDDPELYRRFYRAFANAFTAETARSLLKVGCSKEKLRDIETALGIEPKTQKSLDPLYDTNPGDGYDFDDEYRPNVELQETDISIIKQYLPMGTLVDLGCGRGRLLKSLAAEGRDIIGIDASAPYVTELNTAGYKAMVATWDDSLPLPDRSVDGVYILGRSLLHSTTAMQWIGIFRDLHELVRNPSDPNQVVVVFDTATGREDYEREEERFAQSNRRLGVTNFRSGSMVDSPDGNFYMDRRNPPESDLRMMAAIGGFELVELARHDYEGRNGRNQDIYWGLKFREQPLTYDEEKSYRQSLGLESASDMLAQLKPLISG